MGELINMAVAERAAVAGAARQFLTFALGGEMYGIGTVGVKEIIQNGSLTEVPNMPDTLRGVINLRGSVVPVIDLAARFGGARSESSKRTCIVIVEVSAEGVSQDIGMIVDAVSAVLEIPESDIEPPPQFGAGLRTDFIQGVAKVEERFVLLLDVAVVLSLEELAALAERGGALGDGRSLHG